MARTIRMTGMKDKGGKTTPRTAFVTAFASYGVSRGRAKWGRFAITKNKNPWDADDAEGRR